MTNFFFERYRPQICRGLHKWCCEQILRHLRLFRAKKNFFKIGNFLTFFAYSGSQISWKMANNFFEKYQPEICCGLHKWCCEQILRHLRLFQAKKFFFEDWQFFDIFCISGAMDFMKHHQWNWSKTPQMVYFENKLRHFSLFPSKIIFYYNLQFLEFFPCL